MSLRVFNSELEVVFETNDFEQDENLMMEREAGTTIRELTLPANFFTPGQYYIGVSVIRKKGINNFHNIQKIDHVAPFEVFDEGSVLARHSMSYHGLVHPIIKWVVQDFCPDING